MGGGLLRTNNQQERKTKKLLGILGIGLVIGVVNVRAITSHEVTYENQGVTENLTETLDKLYRELKEYKTSGSVTSTEMLEGSTGYAKGKLVTGSIKKKGSTTYTPGVNNQVISKGQYLNEDQVILGDNNLKSENIKSGVEIFGISGSIKDYSGKTLEATTITSDETYTYLNIPEEAIYDTSSIVKIANSVLNINAITEKGRGYIRYEDGTQICYGTKNSNVTTNVQFGSMFRTANYTTVTFPKQFIKIDALNISQNYSQGLGYSVISGSNNALFNYYNVEPQSGTYNESISYIAIGTWK